MINLSLILTCKVTNYIRELKTLDLRLYYFLSHFFYSNIMYLITKDLKHIYLMYFPRYRKKRPKSLVEIKKVVLLHPLWEHSSAGSEHLPYKQRVTGSNPVAPTPK